jgi:hypothetical protein
VLPNCQHINQPDYRSRPVFPLIKTIDEIAAFREALPGATRFATAFAPQIAVVEVADVDARAAEQAALQALGRHRAALAALRIQVEEEANADWTYHELEQARAAALRCSLEMAAMLACA